jgi:chorismate synthase
VIKGVPAGVGEPVFDKLDARLAYAVMSIGAVKGFEVGDGFVSSLNTGSVNNDQFENISGTVYKKTNHAGGILGGISDGSEIIFRAAIKPTPSISKEQETVNKAGENVKLKIKGRHDPVIVPRAIVVVESMAAIALLDLIYAGKNSRI